MDVADEHFSTKQVNARQLSRGAEARRHSHPAFAATSASPLPKPEAPPIRTKSRNKEDCRRQRLSFAFCLFGYAKKLTSDEDDLGVELSNMFFQLCWGEVEHVVYTATADEGNRWIQVEEGYYVRGGDW